MAKKPRENRIPIMMSEDELRMIDDWRYNNRVATRSDAVRRLCRLGLVLDQNLDELTQREFQVAGQILRAMEFLSRVDAPGFAQAGMREKAELEAAKLETVSLNLNDKLQQIVAAVLSVRSSEKFEAIFESLKNLRVLREQVRAKIEDEQLEESRRLREQMIKQFFADREQSGEE
ncbi:hypothetical protein EN866_33455 [Mesorhizobium sp. M2D.F.Ca.ET.223.01.1.1]|uniref:hypothetical protein n=1 Tax=Mesorhizobium sp. M2D.F.Ca.ET.223.01.1.1 TaxID=2563940 RepID=UPI0010926A83|nr:hypothetical protein [Mesorhizobium sp. M2D.F.Ca.ET.223.01.1.1]TGR84253.1 hypothetical protein EN866_33455 [Mesorhizobium sp. M2D.F.Ca.ET.223.01.1.1]TGT75197.1 hypothetical protein EN802_09340 [bacterium M00.F.Ca.ET.159.01.1.1]TGT88064.1 hypothetical protein EN800_06230 [bacterium M00.F.Ca.ET.157.01.1.1]